MERGFGCMRLSTDPARHRSTAEQVLDAAIQAGATLLDTADAYGLGAQDVGHNERLVAEALRSAPGPIRVSTKGGMIRPGGRWVARGTRKHLLSAAEASAERLGRPPDLFLLHAVDPRVPFETSVRALAAVESRGLARAVGLSNVRLDQLRRARELANIRAVQIAFHLFDGTAVRGGLLDYCRAEGVEFIAHSPLGGPRRSTRIGKHAVLRRLAANRSPQSLLLSWMRDVAPEVTTIPGTRVPGRVHELLELEDLGNEARRALDELSGFARLLRVPRDERRPQDPTPGDVVLVMGSVGSGKSHYASTLVDAGYARLNRDLEGGTLAGLVPKLSTLLGAPNARVVLDNTYRSRAQRNEVIEASWESGYAVRGVMLGASVEQCRRNVVRRILDVLGRLPTPAELKNGDPARGIVGPNAIDRFLREFEPPGEEEGFSMLESVPGGESKHQGTGSATLIDVELIASGMGRDDSLDPDQVALRPRTRTWLETRPTLLLTAWLPQAEGAPERADVCFRRLEALLGFPIHWETCVHPAGPPVCWCRRPLPGLALSLLRRSGAAPEDTVVLGSTPTDRSFARAAGLRFRSLEDVLQGLP
ncbi:MAG: aldo/keto reductase [Myxococcota bacterium]